MHHRRRSWRYNFLPTKGPGPVVKHGYPEASGSREIPLPLGKRPPCSSIAYCTDTTAASLDSRPRPAMEETVQHHLHIASQSNGKLGFTTSTQYCVKTSPAAPSRTGEQYIEARPAHQWCMIGALPAQYGGPLDCHSQLEQDSLDYCVVEECAILRSDLKSIASNNEASRLHIGN